MVAAVEGPLGRQFTTGAKVPGVTTAGKSGTAELGGTRRAALVVHRLRAGRDTRQVAIAVIVEQAGRGAEVAAPIAGDLMALLPGRRRLKADVDEPDVGPPTDPDRPADGPPDERLARPGAACPTPGHRADRPGR